MTALASTQRIAKIGRGRHAVVAVLTLSGAVVGAAICIPGGAAVIAAGIAVGMAVGFIAGFAMEREGAHHDAHERALDRAIGVEGPDLGAGEIARDSLTHAERAADGLGTTLRRAHPRIERIGTELVNALGKRDWVASAALWRDLDSSLRTHFTEEAEEIFPKLREIEPAETRSLTEDHEALLAESLEVGVAIERQNDCETKARALLSSLRAHARREDALAYPWADALIA